VARAIRPEPILLNRYFMSDEKLYFRRAYPYFGHMYWPGDALNRDVLKPHVTIMLKNSAMFLKERDLIECIKSGAVKVPPKGEYYEKACEILNQKIEVTEEVVEQPSVEEAPAEEPVKEEVKEESVEDVFGEIQPATIEATPEVTPEVTPEADVTYTKELLSAMKMYELRVIGEQFGVKDNDKSELIEKILEKQGG